MGALYSHSKQQPERGSSVFTVPRALLTQMREFSRKLNVEVQIAYDVTDDTIRYSHNTPSTQAVASAPRLPTGHLTLDLHTHPTEALYGRSFPFHPPTEMDYKSNLGESLLVVAPVTSVVVEPNGVWLYQPTLGLLLYLLKEQADLPSAIRYNTPVVEAVMQAQDAINTNTGILGHQLAHGEITLADYLTEIKHYLLHPPPPSSAAATSGLGEAKDAEQNNDDDGFDVQFYPFDTLDYDLVVRAWNTSGPYKAQGCDNPGIKLKDFLAFTPFLLQHWSNPTAVEAQPDEWIPSCTLPRRRQSVTYNTTAAVPVRRRFSFAV